MRFNDAVFGIVLIAFAIAMIAHTTTFPRLHGQDYGPDLFPVITGAGLIACGLALLAKGVRERASVPLVAVGEWAREPGRVVDVGLLLASIVFYVVASDTLGFIPVSLLIMTTLLVRLGSGWPTSLLVALVTTFVIHALFAKLLLVPLPWGLLQPIAW